MSKLISHEIFHVLGYTDEFVLEFDLLSRMISIATRLVVWMAEKCCYLSKTADNTYNLLKLSVSPCAAVVHPLNLFTLRFYVTCGPGWLVMKAIFEYNIAVSMNFGRRRNLKTRNLS